MMEHAAGQPTADDALPVEQIGDVTEAMCAAVGIDTRGAALRKYTINAVVVLPAAGAVLRIAGSAPTRARIHDVLAAAAWFEQCGAPAVRLWPGLPQPLRSGPHLATLWELAADSGTEPTPTDLAQILVGIHALEPGPGIPVWSPLLSVRRRLTNVDHIDRAVTDFLVGQVAIVEQELPRLFNDPLLQPGVIHGDAHLGNLIATDTGPVICDFDSTSVGLREWDLTPAAVGAIRFDYGPGAHEELSAAYGVDVTTWSGFPTLRRLRELQLVTSVIPLLDANPDLRAQWQFRIDTLLRGTDERWTPFADL